MKNIQRLYTQSTLAKRCKVSLQTIKNWCLWAGLTPPKKATYFSCDELEALADFYIAYKFLRVQQDAYIDTVLGMGGLRKYIAVLASYELTSVCHRILNSRRKSSLSSTDFS